MVSALAARARSSTSPRAERCSDDRRAAGRAAGSCSTTTPVTLAELEQRAPAAAARARDERSGALADAAFDAARARPRARRAASARLSLRRPSKARRMRRACASVRRAARRDAGRDAAGALDGGRGRALAALGGRRGRAGAGAAVDAGVRRRWCSSRAVRPGWELLLARAAVAVAGAGCPPRTRSRASSRWLRERVGEVEWAERGDPPPRPPARRADHARTAATRALRRDHRRRPARGPGRVCRGHGRARRGAVRAGRAWPHAAARRAAAAAHAARLTPAELVAGSQIPERFREVHRLYLEAYAAAHQRRLRHDAAQAQLAGAAVGVPGRPSTPRSQARRRCAARTCWRSSPHAIARAREVQRRQPRAGRPARTA